MLGVERLPIIAAHLCFSSASACCLMAATFRLRFMNFCPAIQGEGKEIKCTEACIELNFIQVSTHRQTCVHHVVINAPRTTSGWFSTRPDQANSTKLYDALICPSPVNQDQPSLRCIGPLHSPQPWHKTIV